MKSHGGGEIVIDKFISHYFLIIILSIAIFAKISTFIVSRVIRNHEYKKMLHSMDAENRRNLQFMEEVNRQQFDEMNRQFTDETLKNVTPIEHGGYNDNGGMNNF